MKPQGEKCDETYIVDSHEMVYVHLTCLLRVFQPLGFSIRLESMVHLVMKLVKILEDELFLKVDGHQVYMVTVIMMYTIKLL